MQIHTLSRQLRKMNDDDIKIRLLQYQQNNPELPLKWVKNAQILVCVCVIKAIVWIGMEKIICLFRYVKMHNKRVSKQRPKHVPRVKHMFTPPLSLSIYLRVDAVTICFTRSIFIICESSVISLLGHRRHRLVHMCTFPRKLPDMV